MRQLMLEIDTGQKIQLPKDQAQREQEYNHHANQDTAAIMTNRVMQTQSNLP